MSIAILVPIKHPASAKLRLAGLLNAAEREVVAQALFEDLARALGPLVGRVPIIAVTSSERAAGRATALGWRVIAESEQISESASVDRAAARLGSEGASSVLRLPADLPLILTSDIEDLLRACPPAPGALLVPSRDHLGTNALLRTPPLLFPARFGHNSLVLHTQEARRAGGEIRVIESAGVALDVDEPADLAEVLRIGRPSETLRALRRLGLDERLGRRAG